MSNKYVNIEPIRLYRNSELTERWVQNRIAEDPSILGLGDLVLRDQERIQPTAGRLDLLLQDPDANRRYEVELQLGRSDEAHIIRAIEYWDIERKRYPQYDHCAVIVAEDITSRFLNVISLFNGHIPLIAIQMRAYRLDDERMTLLFTTVVDELTRGLDDEDEEREVTDRAYWEKKACDKTMELMDTIHQGILEFAPGYELKYNKFYVGMAQGEQANNFVVFRPRKTTLNIDIRLDQSDAVDQQLEEAGFDLLDYMRRYRLYRIRITPEVYAAKKDIIVSLLKSSWENDQ